MLRSPRRWLLVVALLLGSLGPPVLDMLTVDVCTRQGEAMVHRGRYRRAVRQFGRAIDIEPTYAPAHHGRGRAHLKLGAWDRALADLDEAVRLDPGCATAYLSRSRVHARRGDERRARADRMQTTAIDPGVSEGSGRDD